MTGTTQFPLVSGAQWPGSARALVRVEKASAGNGLHNRSTADGKRRDTASGRTAQETPSRSETLSASLWHGPRLSAPFVAQILGQVLPQSGPDTLSARAAYGGARPIRAIGHRLDRDI